MYNNLVILQKRNIVDIFSFAYTSPLRIEFDGDTVESIRRV